mmetsp:Transcript_18519/g.41951  ORF Transcript_18519/g.41951 Transcript_18519/m.41951 type:complete len:363 (-) Transcript_18519:77-1165(-)
MVADCDAATARLRDSIGLGRVFGCKSPAGGRPMKGHSLREKSIFFPGESLPESCTTPKDSENQSTDDDYEAFDVADDLEKGLANNVGSTGPWQPLVASKELMRYTVFLDNSGEHILVSPNLAPRLTARYSAQEKRVEFFYASQDDNVIPSSANEKRRPAFVMTRSEDATEWLLLRTKCECCMQRPRHLTCEYMGKGQQVARIQHSRRMVGDVKARVHYVDVHVPPVLSGGDSAVWCPLWTGKDLGSRSPASTPSGSQSPRRRRTLSDCQLGDLLPSEEDQPLKFHTRLPTWDPEVESLVLNFQDRNNLHSSPRNFMLTDEGGQDKIVLQHAQNDKTTWCLDFLHPLSEIQAFAIAMSSMEWQ